ncbi:hypothetical protein SH2C18_46480 [Clostridium sediminicola]|uniref:TetR/AcrR family transcriptional regulator n=1 Tax=Clostridium sediminicola TaxID=3114879 RepID=UPI0031F2286D
MPKLIKDIEKNILTSAIELFGEYGFAKVDMKMISSKVGIAVGTLYNYYPNKKDLFIKSFQKSWSGTFYKLNNIMREEVETEKKIRNFLREVGVDSSIRKGVGREFFNKGNFDEKDRIIIEDIKDRTMNMLFQLINDLREKRSFSQFREMDDKMAYSLFNLLIHLSKNNSYLKEDNVEFLFRLIDTFYR